MSSTLRAFASISDSTKFHHIKTVGYYNDVLGSAIPVPFEVNNGVIDISLEDDVFAQLIDAETAGTEYIEGLAKSMGGQKLATSLGPNFIAWLNNWVANYYNDTVLNTFSVYIPATMTRVQVTDEESEDYDVLENDISDEPWGVSLEAPSSDNYIRGDSNNKFLSRWVFKTPLTIQFLLDGSPRYLTYNTTFAPMYD